MELPSNIRLDERRTLDSGVVGQTQLGLAVLGMHRSGTSAVAGVLAHAGAKPPKNPMPAAEDNPRGYWESRRVAQFNNALLQAAGTRWNCPRPVGDDWFASPDRESDAACATALMAEEYADIGTIVCKDPRICRLLPFWKHAWKLSGRQWQAVLVLRAPADVATSLRARAKDEHFRPAAVESLPAGLLLWLRYNLDAERHSRDMPRVIVDYETMLGDWHASLKTLFGAGVLPEPNSETSARIRAFLDPGLNRQKASATAPDILCASGDLRILDVVRTAITSDDRQLLDRIRTHFDRLTAPVRAEAAESGGRSEMPPSEPASILAELGRLAFTT